MLGAEPLKAWQLEIDPGATHLQLARLDFWLAQRNSGAKA
jgi:hypothetical protein